MSMRIGTIHSIRLLAKKTGSSSSHKEERMDKAENNIPVLIFFQREEDS